MTTNSERNSDRADRNVNRTISNDDQKNKDDDEEAHSAQFSSTDGYQGEKSRRKGNDSIQLGKTDTLSNRPSLNENKKSDRMSPTSNESSDNEEG